MVSVLAHGPSELESELAWPFCVVRNRYKRGHDGDCRGR